MNQGLTLRNSVLLVLFFALVQVILQLGLLTGGVRYVAVSLAIDDTYYYVQTAWNTKLLGFVTFDGLHSTNGVQLLWFVIILSLAMVVKTKTVLLFATLAVTFLLNGLCFLAIIKIGAVLRWPALALLMAALWSLQSLPFRIYSMGMENSLHALIVWSALWQSTLFLRRVQQGHNPNWWGLTTVLILNVWTRLDSALLSAILYTFCVGTLVVSHRNHVQFFSHHGKAIGGSMLLAGIGGIAQLTAFRLMGGSFLPVSALVKTSGVSRGLSTEAIDKFVEVFALGMPSFLQGRFPTLALVSLGFLGILLVMRERRWKRTHSEDAQLLLDVWACILVAEALYYFYVAVSGVQYTRYFMWYRSPSFIFWILTGSLLVLLTVDRIVRAKKHSLGVLRAAPVGLSFIVFALAIYLFARSITFSSRLYVARYQAAQWVAETSSPDTIFASWNSGQLGFFSNRTFINLDGVINNVDYYEQVVRGRMPLTEYLAENNVDYLIDYDTYASVPDFPVTRTFPINDGSGRALQIWRISPTPPSTP